MVDIEQSILDALPGLEKDLELSMHRALKSKLPAKDVVQETYARALASIDSFEYRGDQSLRAWLKTIAKNIIRGKIRRRYACELGDLVSSIVESGVLRPSELMRRKEEFTALTRVVGELPANYQTLLRMRYHDSCTFEEIAAMMGLTSGAVRGIHRNAIDKLRKILNFD